MTRQPPPPPNVPLGPPLPPRSVARLCGLSQRPPGLTVENESDPLDGSRQPPDPPPPPHPPDVSASLRTLPCIRVAHRPASDSASVCDVSVGVTNVLGICLCMCVSARIVFLLCVSMCVCERHCLNDDYWGYVCVCVCVCVCERASLELALTTLSLSRSLARWA
ncbi:unnamed protein product [Gadus morhua 'NCC']